MYDPVGSLKLGIHYSCTRKMYTVYKKYILYIVYIMYIVYTRNMSKILKVKTVQVGEKLVIMNGVDPIRYVDLRTNKVHQYDNRKWWQKLLRRGQNPLRIIVRIK